MNIFMLDSDPRSAARYHNDKHVVKMILESAQLLSTAHRVLDSAPVVTKRNGRKYTMYPLPQNMDSIYRATHINHPSAIWVRESAENYMWLYQLFVALLAEFQFRRDKVHKCSFLVDQLAKIPKNIPQIKMTPIKQAMPDEFKHEDGVTAYRNYYVGGKSHLAQWTRRERPDWYPIDSQKQEIRKAV